jgi:glucose-1-phosphate adenylyltransferase
MKIDSTGRIIQFAEKPKGTDLKAMVVSLYLSHFFLSSNS